MTFTKLPNSLENLLQYIDDTHPIGQETWNDSTIESIDGGVNNLVYRVKHKGYDFACKFTIRDERNRARREFVALRALREEGLEIAPAALWLDENTYSQPVVLQTWIDGQSLSSAPKTSSDWRCLLKHYSLIHSLKKRSFTDQIDNAALNFQNGHHGKTKVLQTANKIPLEARPDELIKLLQWFEDWNPPSFPSATLSLCRVDANWRNFIKLEDECVSVDWENSGWGDSAFEIADLMTHPAYEGVSLDEWESVIQTYIKLINDPDCEIRIRTYYLEMQMWWVIRWVRYLYEIPRGLDNRLAKRSDDWKLHTERKLNLSVKNLRDYIEKL